MKVQFKLGEKELFDESDMDEYAIKFAQWISNPGSKMSWLPDYMGGWHNPICNNDLPDSLDSGELLEIFKKQKL